jgi:hypothetical protein
LSNCIKKAEQDCLQKTSCCLSFKTNFPRSYIVLPRKEMFFRRYKDAQKRKQALKKKFIDCHKNVE